MKKLLTFVVLSTLALSCQDSPQDQTEEIEVAQTEAAEQVELLPLVPPKQIKNIILFIGDGTGLNQITAGQYALVGPEGLLQVQKLPVTGFVKTYSSDDLITDSAAGATAFSCGLKTYNGAIGVDKDGKACKTILEMAEERGMSTGLVSTSSITHATPASFAAHVEQRSMQYEIAAQFLNSGTDVLLGGGLEWFAKESRPDSLDLLGDFSKAGYQVVKDESELLKANAERLLGLFAEDGLEREEGEPSTSVMTREALNILKNNVQGFFLMVEGSQIDWGGHANNSEYVIREVQDFDQSIKTAIDFAREDGETLVLVTADHETGGMTLQRQKKEGKELEVYWTTDYHTGTPVPLMAYGPNAEEFMGWRENDYVGRKMAELLKLGSLPEMIN